MSGKRRGNGPFKMTLAQQARTMSYYNPAIKKENFLTADRNEILPGLSGQGPNLDLRGGPNFDPVKYVKEVSHVEYMHADSLLIHPISLRN